MWFEALRHAWRDLSRFKSVGKEKRSIVFYAQDIWAWKHFEPIIQMLLETPGQQVCYITSNRSDPVLQTQNDRIQAFYVGLGPFRTLWFQSLEADVVVMTLPDLGIYHIKRSPNPVHYVYVHHSMVSTHMVYRPNAFDHFDSIMCVGPHHQDEILATEKLYRLEPKILVDAGYGVLDSILASEDSAVDDYPQTGQKGKRVLVAPSWGGDGLLETKGLELVEVLLAAGHQVTVRPHYMTIKNHPKLLKELRNRFGADSGFALSTDLKSQGTVRSSDIMISDWSGAALEFAFGLCRPVLFVDVPRKINNPEYQKIGIEPIEAGVRSQIGEVVSPDRLSEIPAAVDRLCEKAGDWQDVIRELRNRSIYNIGSSAKVSADYISQVAADSRSRL